MMLGKLRLVTTSLHFRVQPDAEASVSRALLALRLTLKGVSDSPQAVIDRRVCFL